MNACLGIQAGAAKSLKEKNELLAKASGQLFKARELDSEEQLPSIAYGQLALAKVRIPKWHLVHSIMPKTKSISH